MTTTSTNISSNYNREDWTGRLTPSDVHHVLFTRAGLGRRGYDEGEVDGFLERVQQELTRLISEKVDLRDEVARLKSQLAQAGSAAPSADGALSKDEANLQAVRLLAAAQQTADTYVADAEKYSQRLTIDAREHSEQILEDARRAAQAIRAEAERGARDAATRTIEGEVVGTALPSKEELQQQVEYLKTFGQVVRVQLRAYLEALLRDVEEEWGRADPAALKGIGERKSSSSPDSNGAAPASPALPVVLDRHAEDSDAADDSDAASNGSATGHARTRKKAAVSLHAGPH